MFTPHAPRTFQCWWIALPDGGYDGIEFRRDGQLHMLNWDLFLGTRWWMESNVLHTEYVQRTHLLRMLGKPESDRKLSHKAYTVESLSDRELVLVSPHAGGTITEKYIATPVDAEFVKFFGHWYGPGESYLQVVAENDFYFKIVVSPNEHDQVVKYEGRVHAGTAPMEFEMSGQTIALHYDRPDDQETLEVAGVRYTRERK